MIAPALLSSELSRDFAALNLVSADLSFALNCLREADGLGIPDSSKPTAGKPLIAEKYGKAEKTDLSVEVKAGAPEGAYDLKLSGP